MDRETAEWDFQNYVLEILDKLKDGFVLEKDDEDYREVRSILKEKRGRNCLVVSLYGSYFRNML